MRRQRILGLIVALLFYTRVIRPILNLMTTSMEVVPESAEQLTTSEMNAVEEEKRRLGEVGAEMTEIRQLVNDFAASDPKYTAGIVRKWMKDKGPAK